MTLDDLGYNQKLAQSRAESNLDSFEIGRIIEEHKERYVVKSVEGEYPAEITGNMRFSAKSRDDFPAVGDWVALSVVDSDFAIIHAILPHLCKFKDCTHTSEAGCAVMQAVEHGNLDRKSYENYLTMAREKAYF